MSRTEILLVILILCILFSNVGIAYSSASLTPEEQAFVEANPQITLASGISFDPFTVENEDGTIGGIDADIAQLIYEKTGLKIVFKRGKWQEMTRKAAKREYDGLSATVRKAEREKIYNFSSPYITLTTLVLVKKDNPLRIFSKKDMAGKTVSLQKGNLLFEGMMADYSNKVNFIYEDSLDDVIRDVVSGKSDFTILDETAFYIASKVGLSTMIEAAFPIGEPFEVVFSLRNDMPLLHSIVNKGLKSITEQERASIRNRWLGAAPQKNQELAGKIVLSDVEKQFLTTKNLIRVGIVPTRMPYEGFTADGKLQGMAANYLAFISESLGSSVELYPIPVKDSLQAVKNNRCDIVMIFEGQSKDFQQIEYTSPLLTFPYVIATTDETLFIEDLDQKSDEIFLIVDNDPAIDRLKKMYPTIKLMEISDVHQGLKAVSNRAVFGLIGPSAEMIYTIQNEFLADLKVAGKIPVELNLVLATRSDTPMMNHIFQKIVGLLQQEERWQFINQWVAVKYEQTTNYNLVWKVIGVTSVILLVIIIWNRKLNIARKELKSALIGLKKTRNELRKKNAELEELSITDKLTGLYNRMKLDFTLKAEINRSKRYVSPFSIIIMDIDHFKSINDKYGHQEGDKVLKQVAGLLEKNTREVDIVGRWGGEEFLILCPETTIDHAWALAEKLRTVFEQSDENKCPITASFGVATFQKGMEESKLMSKADDALYRAKEKGRNRVEKGYDEND